MRARVRRPRGTRSTRRANRNSCLRASASRAKSTMTVSIGDAVDVPSGREHDDHHDDQYDRGADGGPDREHASPARRLGRERDPTVTEVIVRTHDGRRPTQTFAPGGAADRAGRLRSAAEGDEPRLVGSAHVLAARDRCSLGGLMLLDSSVELFDFGVEFGEAGTQCIGGGSGVWRNLAQPRPADRISPRTADHRRALVAGPRRSAFAAQRIAGVVSPQPSVVHDPRGGLIDHDRLPPAFLAGPDRNAVTAGVVDVRDRQAGVLDVGVSTGRTMCEIRRVSLEQTRRRPGRRGS